jgi:hypothetical protein
MRTQPYCRPAFILDLAQVRLALFDGPSANLSRSGGDCSTNPEHNNVQSRDGVLRLPGPSVFDHVVRLQRYRFFFPPTTHNTRRPGRTVRTTSIARMSASTHNIRCNVAVAERDAPSGTVACRMLSRNNQKVNAVATAKST